MWPMVLVHRAGRSGSYPIGQDSIYNTVHETTIKGAVKGSKSPADACEMGSMAQALQMLDELIKAEKKNSEDTTLVNPEEQKKKKDVMDVGVSVASAIIEKIKVKRGVEELDEDTRVKIKEAELKATRLMNSHAGFGVIPSSEKKAREMLQASGAGKIRGEEGVSYVGIFFDPGLMGEPITAPHVRVNPINQPVLKAPL